MLANYDYCALIGQSTFLACTTDGHLLLSEPDWRVEPSVKFYCEIAYDPFLSMMDKGAVYGFTLSLFEYAECVSLPWYLLSRQFAHPSLGRRLQDHPHPLGGDEEVPAKSTGPRAAHGRKCYEVPLG